MRNKTLAILTGLFVLTTFNSFSQLTHKYLTNDGAWCWFSDPRAIVDGDHIITGWVKKDGTIEACNLNYKTSQTKHHTLFSKFNNDDHDNPAFVTTASGDILAFYTMHSKQHSFHYNLLKANNKEQFAFEKPIEIYPIDKNEFKKFPKRTITYANPYKLEKENDKLYCFGRWTGFKPNFMTSTDDGKTWSKSKVFITNYPFNKQNRPYAKYYSDGKSKIHIIFTDGHPRKEPTNSVYYTYYEGGKFHKANGEVIADMNSIPFEPKDATKIYESTLEEGRAWIADMTQDKKGNPVILYTKSPSEEDHRYWYARYVKGKWINHEICKSGKWFPKTLPGKTEREPHYFGGMTVHPDNANVIYVSRQIKGVFEIERMETKNCGKTWKTTTITSNSKLDNVRPYIPRGLKKNQEEVVFWMENTKYIHYKNYDTSIKYTIVKK